MYLSADHPFRVFRKPELQGAALVVGWSEDAGKLGTRIVDYLNEKLGGREIGELEPTGFFPLSGVSVEDDVAQFPESKLYCCPENSLVTFRSNAPRFEWHSFLNSLLDVAEEDCRVKELYTVGAMVSMIAHTAPRELLVIANSSEMKRELSKHDLSRDVDFETRPTHRPTLSSYLLWVAKRRKLAAASFWVPVPFYLVSTEDPLALKIAVESLDRRFGWGIDLRDLDEAVAKQNERIARARVDYPEIDGPLRKLENGRAPTQEESDKLVRVMEDLLR